MNEPTNLERNLIRLWIYLPVALLIGLVLAIEDLELPGILVGLGIAFLLAVFIRWFETKLSMHAKVEGQRRALVHNMIGASLVMSVANTLIDHGSFLLNLGCAAFGFFIVAPYIAFFDVDIRWRFRPFRNPNRTL